MKAEKTEKPKAKKPRARKIVAKAKSQRARNAVISTPAECSEPTADVRGPLPAALPSDGKAKKGRSTEYDPAIAQEILELLADGQTLNSICADERFPAPRTVRRWALDDQHPFAPHYARARLVGYHAIGDELFDTADDGRNDWMARNDPENPGWSFNGEHVQRSKLRVETRKWFLSKALPKIYGDKIEIDTPKDGAFAQAAAVTSAAIAALIDSK